MLDTLITALNATNIPFVKYGWNTSPKTDYGVVSIDGSGEVFKADGKNQALAIEGTVDLFTRDAGETQRQAVQSALNSVDGLSWYLNSTQFESDTRLVHFEWVFQFAEAVS